MNFDSPASAVGNSYRAVNDAKVSPLDLVRNLPQLVGYGSRRGAGEGDDGHLRIMPLRSLIVFQRAINGR